MSPSRDPSQGKAVPDGALRQRVTGDEIERGHSLDAVACRTFGVRKVRAGELMAIDNKALRSTHDTDFPLQRIGANLRARDLCRADTLPPSRLGFLALRRWIEMGRSPTD